MHTSYISVKVQSKSTSNTMQTFLNHFITILRNIEQMDGYTNIKDTAIIMYIYITDRKNNRD